MGVSLKTESEGATPPMALFHDYFKERTCDDDGCLRFAE